MLPCSHVEVLTDRRPLVFQLGISPWWRPSPVPGVILLMMDAVVREIIYFQSERGNARYLKWFYKYFFSYFHHKCLMNILASVLLFFILFWMSFKEPPLMASICYHFYYQLRYRRMWNWWGWSWTWAVWRKQNLFEHHRQLHLPVWGRLSNKDWHSDIFCWVTRRMCW